MDTKREILDSSILSSSNFSTFLSSTSQNFNGECNSKIISNNDIPTRKKLSFLIDGFNESIEQNLTLNHEISSLFSQLDLKANKFSNSVKELFKKLIIIEGEDLLDLDEITLRMHFIHKKIEEKKHETENRKMKNKYDNNFKNYNKLDKKLQKLFEAVMELESEIQNEFKSLENDNAKQILLENKESDYERKIEQMKTDIQDMNIMEIHPSNILMKADTYSQKNRELNQLNEDLNYYADLPPNLVRAKDAVKRKSQEYEQIKNQLDKKMFM